MLKKRIIPCLDIKDGRTVKGVQFQDLKDAGDPVALAALDAEQGADELVLLDITATVEKRKTFPELVRAVAARLDIPFTVGGGISSVADVTMLLQSGADKVSVNSAAFRRPELLQEISAAFGSQCLVLAIDARQEQDGEWYVYLDGGRTPTGKKAIDWAIEGVECGAGEILLTSMDHDGSQNGFATEFTRALSVRVPVPVIASGGAGTAEHFLDLFKNDAADAALAAGVFHFGKIQLPQLKSYLLENGIAIRPQNI